MDTQDNQQPAKITRIGKYDVLDELGRGGMGVVYRGIDENIGREVAIKTLTKGFMSDPDMLARFYDEVRTTGRLNHPNIVTVYHLGVENDVPYIVMERLEGSPLDKLLLAHTPIPLSDRLKIVEDVCSALANAHQNNVIHRDVKPANIFVQHDGNVKLLDFGIARLEKRDEDLGHTRTGNVIGTIPYMAPERLEGGTVDSRSDIFSAGVVLYELVAGQLPFEGKDIVLMQQILHSPHPPLSSKVQGYPPALDQIIDRALAKIPDDRYSTAEEMAADLNTVNAELKVEQVQKMLPEARRLIEMQDFARARTVLQQLLRIQRKNAGARELLAEIQRHFSARQLEEKVQQLRKEAETALNEKRFDQSLALLKEGLELDTQNTGIAKLIEKVQREKTKQERITAYLREADSARRIGDYKSAIAAAQKALKADKANSKIVALCQLLTKEAEHVQRRAQAKTLLDLARSEMSARRYSDAISLLKETEQLDPTNPELPLLLVDANSGLEQAKRKEAIARLEDAVATVTSYEQLQQAAKAIQEAMVAMPAELALFRLNAEVERQIKEYEDRRFVDETIHKCRDLRPREALEVVQAARQRLPEEERLIALEALLDERVRQQSIQERQGEYLVRAREALKSEQYGEAVRILSMCQAEGIATEEIVSLLEFARSQEAEQNRLNAVRTNVALAQSLMRGGAYDEAIQFLENSLQRTEDAALRLLLNQAVEGKRSLDRQIEAALSSAGRLVQQSKPADAIQLLEKQPEMVLLSDRVQTAKALLQDEMEQALFRTVGRAYAAAENDLQAGDRLVRRLTAAYGDSALTEKIREAFRLRQQAQADRAIEDAMRKCKALLRDRDRAGAGEIAQTVSQIVGFASEQVSREWQKLAEKMAKPGLMSRLRS